MSSALYATTLGAELGNDGVYPTSDVEMMFHTRREDNPWWRVDLLDTYCIQAVYFMNRGHLAQWPGFLGYVCKFVKKHSYIKLLI